MRVIRNAALVIIAVVSLMSVEPAGAADKPLAGKVIVVDPGHQLGNSNPRFAKQLAQVRFNGSIVKGCNTTGTATNAGFPEATFTWRVANLLKPILESKGAKVIFTRSVNTYKAFGPCVWDRAAIANKANADAMISIHADGASPRSKGFFAIAPTKIKGWTTETYARDHALAHAMLKGMKAAGGTPSNYIRDQLMVSGDQSTINFSKVPTTIVELGNMRNAQEASLMSSKAGQRAYAQHLAAGIERYFVG